MSKGKVKGLEIPDQEAKSTVRLEFGSDDLRTELGPLSRAVLSNFDLPSLRLLCYFDNENPDWLHKQFGDFAGLHTPVIGGGTWPQYVSRHFFKPDGGFAFDNLIYVPSTKYSSNRVAFVLLFAHELQHFVQWGADRKLAKLNITLFNNIGRWEPDTKLKPWDIPHNREAMIVAKRIAESLCGRETVADFINIQIDDGEKNHNSLKAALWNCYRGLNASDPYNLAKATSQLAGQFKRQLTALDPKQLPK